MKYKETFAKDLLDWFYINKRDMPWRETKDPYKIWLSEVMLQQTQVNTVKDYYLRFIKKFPDIDSLADTPIDEVAKYWEGLGYYSRIRNFHTAVREVQQQYGSIVPNDPKHFLSLKGVGPYTQGAVMSIAFNHRLPAVDGNVYRVFARIDNDAFDISSSKARKHFEEKVMTVMPGQAGDFNEALMELGATICTPKAPLCMFCPVASHCEALQENTVLQLPVKLKKVKKTVKQYKVLLIHKNDQLIIERRPESGLLASMWQFPMFEVDTHVSDIENIMDMALYIETDPFLKTKHIFTHLAWELEVYMAYTKDKVPEQYTLINLDEKQDYNFPVSMTKIFEYYIAHNQ
ncbi:A/G-specific adenine glycosylase [Macrococcoides caseolyticum]|uniref:A/G-specific adenine glycosylase n=1 Tax=Macrococcoides caseolyticum TaxID=69966 RepID=UPI001F297452|nr:A/G-specific adenine glycosylase [Macrococcus caseolyticus]MCE4957523.1 A/G-specific adenine glycosylase [Macrococcus caseolyticus]